MKVPLVVSHVGGRWSVRMALAYTGYLDESGTHGGSDITVMGGLLGRADQWKRFQVGFDKAKKKHGFRIFHTKKFKNKSGDFKGWSNDQCLALMEDLRPLIAFGLTDGAAITLDNDIYEHHYKGNEKPNKVRLDSKYGLCFRMCVYHFVLETGKRKYRKKIPDLHIVLEAGHQNSGDAERIFAEIKYDLAALGVNMLCTLTLATKDDCDALMMADFIAHTTLTINRNARAKGVPIPESQIIPRGATGITHFESTPEGLANIRGHIIEQLAHKRLNRAGNASRQPS